MLTAQNNQTTTQGLPPLIDRELLFGDPEITAAEVSPDGKYLAFMKPWSKTRNIWVKTQCVASPWIRPKDWCAV